MRSLHVGPSEVLREILEIQLPSWTAPLADAEPGKALRRAPLPYPLGTWVRAGKQVAGGPLGPFPRLARGPPASPRPSVTGHSRKAEAAWGLEVMRETGEV